MTTTAELDDVNGSDRGSSKGPPRSVKPEHLTVGTVLVSVLVGGGGILSFRETAQELRTELKAVSIALVELKISSAAARESSLRSDLAYAKLEERVRALEIERRDAPGGK